MHIDEGFAWVRVPAQGWFPRKWTIARLDGGYWRDTEGTMYREDQLVIGPAIRAERSKLFGEEGS